ncbi:uncharacterized protein ASPGLDRAFT_1040958 [Aspergillus glaucus CBS 516.65]|uniref:Uncharacterized protein n=1 Tax=Aspergillus glaucus CBS 516.65 TaxID=1160497 RepID=A0A1L9V6H3_ASPGL|nr:hypothetical protein ASPGLDRAFT_1040958 [Aspergillus glaucus CBS 516.65]OJJ79520.1 hypothetical protein ASPGLDRAFT_1040958 [Aspergillus glaucus CBS 516.65]
MYELCYMGMVYAFVNIFFSLFNCSDTQYNQMFSFFIDVYILAEYMNHALFYNVRSIDIWVRFISVRIG